ncbi:MAG: hypothetical protein HYV14_07940 [Elusimicrobia bacterium]|nr:hypothetical protein [Elusimicrobiota bacterium]
MRMIMAALSALFLAGAARAGASEKAKILELRASVREGEAKLKRLSVEQHKELVLIREREKSDLTMTRASAARGETLHAALLDVSERSRRQRLELRERRRGERGRLKAAIKAARAEVTALRRKK